MDGESRTGTANASGSPHPGERRLHARVAAMWIASVKTAAGYFECLVIDLSRGGAKLAISARPEIPAGEAVALELATRGSFRAAGVWQRDGYTGIRFLDPPETIAARLAGVLPL